MIQNTEINDDEKNAGCPPPSRSTWFADPARTQSFERNFLDAIIEADAKRSFLMLGYPTLLDWLMKHFKYLKSAAWRRIHLPLRNLNHQNLLPRELGRLLNLVTSPIFSVRRSIPVTRRNARRAIRKQAKSADRVIRLKLITFSHRHSEGSTRSTTCAVYVRNTIDNGRNKLFECGMAGDL